MDKDDRCKAICMDIFMHLVGQGANAARIIEAEPPLIKLFGPKGDVIRITIEAEDKENSEEKTHICTGASRCEDESCPHRVPHKPDEEECLLEDYCPELGDENSYCGEKRVCVKIERRK